MWQKNKAIYNLQTKTHPVHIWGQNYTKEIATAAKQAFLHILGTSKNQNKLAQV